MDETTLLEELKETRRALQIMWLIDGYTHDNKFTGKPHQPLDSHRSEVLDEVGRVMRREKMQFDWLNWFNEQSDTILDPNEGM